MKHSFLILAALIFQISNFSLRAESPGFEGKSSTSIEKAISAVVFVANEHNFFDLAYNCDPDSFYEYLRSPYEWLFPSQSSHGSGFFISEDGYVVTNAHVIEDATSTLIVVNGMDQRIYKASIVGVDWYSDLAVLKIENEDNFFFPYLKFGDMNTLKRGDPITVIGNPLHFGYESTVTTGVVSGKNRNPNFYEWDPIQGYLQIDAAVVPGNSGGPVINSRGDVVGVIKWGFTRHQGMNFAIPSHIANIIVDELISKGSVTRGSLGVILEVSSEVVFDSFVFEKNQGATICEVCPNSPAEDCGLMEEDIVIELNGYPITSADDFINLILAHAEGASVCMKVKRGGDILEMIATLDEDDGVFY